MRTHPAFVRLLHVLALILLSGLFVLGTGCVHDNDPWYYQKEVSYPFSTPEYTFSEGSFRRLNYID